MKLPGWKVKVLTGLSDIVEPRLLRVSWIEEMVYPFDLNGRPITNSGRRAYRVDVTCNLRFVKKYTLVAEGLSRSAKAGYLGVYDPVLLKAALKGIAEVREEPLAYSEMPRLLTGMRYPSGHLRLTI